MNEQLQQAVAELITKSISTTEGAISFLYAELPEVIQQLLVWKIISSSITFTIFIILLSICAWSVKVTYTMCDGDDTEVAIIMPICITTITAFFSVITYDITWLQILIAPKVYLLEYASQLLK